MADPQFACCHQIFQSVENYRQFFNDYQKEHTGADMNSSTEYKGEAAYENSRLSYSSG